MTAIFKCEYTPHKAVGIQWVAICEVFCIVTVYSECHRSPGNVPSVSYALLHLIFNATLGDIEQAMLAPIYRHWNCGSESEAPIHNQGAVEIPGDPGACVPELVHYALQSVCDWVLLVPTQESPITVLGYEHNPVSGLRNEHDLLSWSIWGTREEEYASDNFT